MALSKIDPSITLAKLQSDPESQYFDRKSQRLACKDFAHHLSAFANASGGVVAIGIEDNGEITGVTDEKENEFRKTAFEFLRVPPQYQTEKISCQDKNGNHCFILLFHIESNDNEIITLKTGDAYLRVGDSSRKLNNEQYVALEYSKGIKSYESRIIEDATLEDLDQNLVGEYVKRLDPTVSSQLDILRGRGLIRERNGRTLITVAAILLFGKHPTQFLPAARVRFLRYEGVAAQVGTQINIVKEVNLEKPLHLLLADAKMLLESQMREFQQLSRDGIFVKIPEYPTFAWLEGLVNAVAHRDYSIQGDHIRITMFDDRIEFSSPGRLPSIVTVDNIQTTRFSRNPMIARVLSDFGWVRELNEGVKRIYTDMASYFLEPPSFSEPNGNTVLLVLKNNIAARSMRRVESLNKYWPDLGSLDRELLFYVANIENSTPKILAEMTGKSRPTVTSHLKVLQEMDLIVEHSTSPRDPTKFYTLHY